MREYVYSIVSLSSAVGVILMLAPDGVRQGLKKHIKFISALCLVCVLINPVSEFLYTFDDLLHSDHLEFIGGVNEGELYEKYDEIYQSYLEGSYGENIGGAVKDALSEKYGIKKENCRVLTEFYDNDRDGIREPKKITVVLSGLDRFRDPEMIKRFLSDIFNCDVAVAIE